MAGSSLPETARGANAVAGTPWSPLADGVLDAFKQHRVVALGEAHELQEFHDAVLLLLADQRIQDAVDDIVVEFGNALYQDVIDRFVAGAMVNDNDLRAVWRNTTQSPLETWDSPIYERFYRMVRAINWARPAGRQLRVHLGDPPIDWPKMRTPPDVQVFFQQRDAHMASVISHAVVGKKRRALFLAGAGHVAHASAAQAIQSAVALLECQTADRVYVAAVALGADAALARHGVALPRGSMVRAAGTWLAAEDAATLQGGGNAVAPARSMAFPGSKHPPTQAPPPAPLRFGELYDALLYLGELKRLTLSYWNPAIFLDPGYWAELERRRRLQPLPLPQTVIEDKRRQYPASYQHWLRG
jgi:hypothetical protein